jgi:ribosomal protein S18 acetylase RimI-like enzyme
MKSIRPATPADASAIHALGQHVSEFSVNQQTVTFWPLETLQRALASDDVYAHVAEVDGALCGFIIATYVSGLGKATIENIYVDPHRRGKGIGDDLLAALLQALQTEGCQYVATLVPADAEGATNLYEHAGFTRGEVFVWLDKPLDASFSSGEPAPTTARHQAQ